MIKCPLCLRTVDKFHERSHLLPEWMYKNAYSDRHKLIKFGITDEYLIKVQNGIYDEIICLSCEVESQQYDHYASLVLTERSPESVIHRSVKRNYQERFYNGTKRKFSFWENIDFYKFQKFIFICVLRTHLSNLKKGKPLLIDKHFNNILKLYKSKYVIDSVSYPIMSLEYINNNGYENIVILPFANKKDGHFIIEFSGCKYNFVVYVSSHRRPQYVNSLKLQENGSMYIIHDYIENTGTFKNTIPKLKNIADTYPNIKI